MAKKISNWNDFIRSDKPYEEKIVEVKSSNIFTTNPKDARKL